MVFLSILGTGQVRALGSAATPTAAAEPSMGLMIQVSSLQSTSTATLKRWLESIRTDHHDSSKTGYIGTVVLQDVADSTGALYMPYLDVIAPYLPGGATRFLSMHMSERSIWRGPAAVSKYVEGIENSAFRAQNVNVSLAVAKTFSARYPEASTDWYITYEANVSGFWDAQVEGAYRIYVSQLMTTLSGVRGGKEFLWSPAFWTMYADEPAWAQPDLKANLSDLFTHLSTHLTLDIQDYVGQFGGASTKESAASWIAYLKQNWTPYLTKVQMNAEQFTQSANGAITAGNTVEVPARESYYESKNIELGPAWEITYWHQRLYGN